jgi:hypothetical protein
MQKGKISEMKKLMFPLALLLGVIALGTTPSTESPALQAQNNRQQQKPPFIVCIDPGHPSETSAGANAHGLSENRLNWQVAVRLAQRLRAMNIPYVLTKASEKQYVTNRRRAEIANGANPYRRPTAILFACTAMSVRTRASPGIIPTVPGAKARRPARRAMCKIASRSAAHTMNSAMIPVLRGYLRTNPIKTDACTYVGGKQAAFSPARSIRVGRQRHRDVLHHQKADAQFIASTKGQEKMAKRWCHGIALETITKEVNHRDQRRRGRRDYSSKAICRVLEHICATSSFVCALCVLCG